MPARVLIVPDKFKGSLTASQAAQAMARGWRKARPQDRLELLPMSDGGDGFGEVLSALLKARAREQPTLDALHRPLRGRWWWQPNEKTAVVESANVIGLAMLPPKKFHPFQLDTFGLGSLLLAAAKAGARKCIVGIGGSSTNDGGFGLARSLGWQFFDRAGKELIEWWQLSELAETRKPSTTLGLPIVVAVDVRNPLLGPKGCSRIYGPQKGLRPQDFAFAEKCLGRLAARLKEQHGIDAAKIPGAGAAGGLGFGLMAFAGAKVESGFDLFARYAHLEKHISSADLVLTGEGAMDEQTAMGKGVGQIARLCHRRKAPCIALAGHAEPSVRKGRLFAEVRALTDHAISQRAQAQAAILLEQLAADMARDWNSRADEPKEPRKNNCHILSACAMLVAC
ncbi:MAG: glycerate kinase [Limisphaerales bacterium]